MQCLWPVFEVARSTASNQSQDRRDQKQESRQDYGWSQKEGQYNSTAYTSANLILTELQPSLEANGYPASHPESNTTPISGGFPQRRLSDRIPSGESHRSQSPLSRTGTPGMSAPNSNIAPQHIFDNVSLTEPNYHSPSLPSFALRQPSPSTASLNGSHLENSHVYSESVTNSSHLKTRVSELEVINDLFRGRVAELEQSEQAARRNAELHRDAADRYRIDLDASLSREKELKRRNDQLEAEIEAYRTQVAPPPKRARLSDIVRDEPEHSLHTSPSRDPVPAVAA